MVRIFPLPLHATSASPSAGAPSTRPLPADRTTERCYTRPNMGGWVVWGLLLTLCCQLISADQTPIVTGVTPKVGSRNGGTRITVHGINFADNFDPNNDPNVGTDIKLVAGSQHLCDLHPDGVTPITATCYTRPMPEGKYEVRVTVNGKPVPEDLNCPNNNDDCFFEVRDSNTPKIMKLTPRSGKPGTLLTAESRLFTSRYGSNTLSQNFKDFKIAKFWAAGKICNVKDLEKDELFGLNLFNDSYGNAGDDGYFKCKPDNDYIGNYNISFIVEEEYGRSLPDPALLHVHAHPAGIGMYQMYTEIAGLSANSGSTEGGLMLTVTGQYFDDTDSPARVLIDGKECRVQEPISSTAIVCETSTPPASTPSVHTGNRGVTLTVVEGPSDYNGAIDWTSGNKSSIDETYHVTENLTDHVVKMEGVFEAPETGKFRFYLKAIGSGKMTLTDPDDNSELTTVTSTGQDEESGPVNLEQDKKYKLEILAGNSGDTEVNLSARQYKTIYQSSQTGAARHEVQELQFNSNKTSEIQMLELEVNSDGSASGQNETQVVELTGNLDASFRLCHYGSCTEWLRADSTSGSALAESLSGLPGVAGESVSVKDIETGTGLLYTITFPQSLGDMRELTAETSEEWCESAVSTTTQGRSPLDTIRLLFGGTVTKPIAVDANPFQVKAALEESAGVRCHEKLSESMMLMDCETSGSCAGERVGYEEPFCGRFSAKNPGILYRGPDNVMDRHRLSNFYRFLCLAHKGPLTSIWMKYIYVDEDEENFAWVSFPIEVPDTEMEVWQYSCLDLLTRVKEQQPGKKDYYPQLLGTSTLSSPDVFVDHVTLGKADDIKSSALGMRMLQARPNGAFIKDISVTGKLGNYTVEIIPYLCGNTFKLISLEASQLLSGSTDTASDHASYIIAAGNNAVTMTNTRLSRASPPIGGTFSVSFGGVSSQEISPTPESREEEVRDALGLIKGLGDVDVTYRGDCSAFTYTVAMATKAGDQAPMTIDDREVTGKGVMTDVVTIEDGSLWYRSIPGDMLRTVHPDAQVTVFINDVPTACASGVDCSFTWSSASTPTITAITPTTGSAAGTPITITGTNFDMSGNSVTIGGTDCSVTSSTTTSIVCTLFAGPSGERDVKVHVPSKGWASGSVTFTFTAAVSSISPTSGSLLGGLLLVITGQGFSLDATVTIDGKTCAIESQFLTQIECLVPPLETTVSTAASVVVNSNTEAVESPTNFLYDESKTPQITGLSSNSVNTWGGDVLTITGTKFGTTIPTVTVGGEALTVVSNSDTEVVVMFPPLQPGSFPLDLVVQDVGLALATTNIIISNTLVVTGLTPSRGSMYGGTLLTITGQGFGTEAQIVEVMVGSHVCTVESVSDTEIQCRVEYTGAQVTVTNQGTHKDLGLGYAFDPKLLTITEGDCVKWVWTTPSFVRGIQYSISQTANDTSKETMEGGFTSPGPSSANGQYKFCFNVPGDYYYWSGYVNPPYNTIYLRGKVTAAPRSSSVEEVVVKVGGPEAQHLVPSSAPSSSSLCDYPKAGCTPASLTNADPSRFSFTLDHCATPTVNSISLRNGTSLDAITFTGTGLGATSTCINEILYAEVGRCEVTPVSNSQLSCTIGTAGPPPTHLAAEFTVRVGDFGNALMAVSKDPDRRFVYLPAVTAAISPSAGSKAGGTLITVSGAGFADARVTINNYECPLKSQSPTEIICSTPKSQIAGKKEVKVFTSGGEKAILCPESWCYFTYNVSVTPQITSVTPTTISSSPTDITITGEGFGSSTDVSVTVGGVICAISSVTNTEVQCRVTDVPAGSHIPEVHVLGKGLAAADSSHAVDSQALISAISPTEGSTYGGTLVTITGHGFKASSTVTIDGETCGVTMESATTIKCETSMHVAGEVSVAVTSNGVTYPSTTFTFSTAATPSVTSINPTDGQAGATVVITGTGFSATTSDNTVRIGGVAATITDATTTSLTITLDNQITGTFPVIVYVSGSGLSNNDVTFEYTLGNVNINPTTGTTAGGQTLMLSGSGFLPQNTLVTVCSEPCVVVGPINATQLECVTPPAPDNSLTCDVVVMVNSVSKTAGSQYTYDPAITPEVSSVTPQSGGTAGGTVLTIAGSGFGTDTSAVLVKVGTTVCDVQTVTDAEITCSTNSSPSGYYMVDVNINSMGSARMPQSGAEFRYIDKWSSIFTWGGKSPPVAGDLVQIPSGQIILLDVNTPVLAMLIVEGTLIFDEADVELHAERILITGGGTFQVGTEENPFPAEYTAKIILHGHMLSKELPIYGSKVLALREGVLDLHGTPTPVTWTTLARTANVSDTTVKLSTPVNWRVGDQIVIPSTSHRHSQNENEVHVITAVSVDGLTLTLRDPLVYKHVAVEHTFLDGSSVSLRGEVGLLSHNVKVIGSVNDEWTEDIPACEAGFDTGEFMTQTCFQGRFGAETGSDQFGAHIIAHAPSRDSEAAVLRLSYIEVTHAGQAFRLGRYPVHLHLNGDMSSSYIRGLGIHNSFNRAVNVHGTHNALIEHVVLYDIMGGAFFLEDGIETNNTFRYNLGTFIRPSSSLRNDDVTPAVFWVTNPNNIIIHNAAAGSSHFGYWYRMKEHPEGPSFDASICPIAVPLGRFENNTAHSLGWFGLWLFEFMFPREGGSCNSDAPTQVAIFERLLAWNCEKGAEAVSFGALQFKDFVLVNNEKAGFEGKLLSGTPQYNETSGAMVDGGMFVAHLGDELDQQDGHKCTTAGIVLPYGNGFLISGVNFYNFDGVECAGFEFARVIGTCIVYCGGFTYHTKGLQWENSVNKVRFDWESEGVFKDLDGSLTDGMGLTVVPTTPSLPPAPRCIPEVSEFSQGASKGSVCDSTVKFHRFSFHNAIPESLEGKDALFTNQFGTTISKFAEKRITHPFGWMVVLLDGECYHMEYENADQISNTSYNGDFYQIQGADSLCLSQKVAHPDRFSVNGYNYIDPSTSSLTSASASHGSWWFNETAGTLTYYIKAVPEEQEPSTGTVDMMVRLRAFTCFFENCEPPEDPTAVKGPPSNALPWSDPATWTGFRPEGKPKEGDSVIIPFDKWLVIDEAIPLLDYLIIEGGLHAASNASLHFTLNVNYIIISGRLAIGWENEPFNGTARIILRGQHSTPAVPHSDGPELGSKFIAVYGGLDLHGLAPSMKWTRLARTVTEGDNVLVLEEPVDWSVGDEIMVTTTDASPWHTETFTVTDITGTSITISPAVQYQHIAHTEVLSSGQNLVLSARVALFSRNIVIEGEDYPSLQQESFGARVIVSRAVYNGTSRNGFARVTNTEFYHTGQEGWTEPYDPRYSLAFVDVLSDNTTNFYSYVRDNTFHDGFSPAVGVFAVENLEVSGNVIHHTVGKAIHTTSFGTHVEGNLMALTIWPGAYLDRYETYNIEFDGAVEAIESTDLVLRNNIVAGCERAGYHLPGQDCSTPMSDQWVGNEAHSCLIGVANFPSDHAVSTQCFMWAGFTVWKNADWGLFIDNLASQIVTNLLSVENGVGYFPFVVGPSAVSHTLADKTVEVRNSTFVGRTSSYSCDQDSLQASDPNVLLSGQCRSWRINSCGMTGISFPSFSSATNRPPQKPFAGTMAYQSIMGHMVITGVKFEKYGEYSGSEDDRAISSNPKNKDMQHPIYISNIDHNIPTNNLLYYHHLSTGPINPSDCVDMNCDGLKKLLVVDSDGSFLGEAGFAMPNSGEQWDADPAFGVGDYRIPKALLTAPNGSRYDASLLVPNKGIYGHKDCDFIDSWNAFKCDDTIRYAMLIFESMDEDTETRRLSPIAVRTGTYIDLLNGPRDHGWCSGYTCRKRLSLFPAIVPLDQWTSLTMTGLVPDNLRFLLLNVEPTDCVALSLRTQDPYRLDVFVDEDYVMPTNGYTKNGGFFLYPQEYPSQYMPDPLSRTSGQNFVSHNENMLYWVQCGQQTLNIRRHEVLMVSFGLPAMTDEEFFGEQLINNLAQFLSVPASKVRIVHIVRETPSAKRRKRRSTPGVYFFVEVGDVATDTSPPVDLDLAALQIVTQVQLYGIDDIVNGTVISTSILEPSTVVADGFADLKEVGSLVLMLNPAGAIEGKPFAVQPTLQVLSPDDEVVYYLGTYNSPWEVEVSLQSGGNGAAVLLGTTTVTFTNGTASFTDLTIDHPDDDYVLRFTVVQPVEASYYMLDTFPFQVSKRPVALLGSVTTNEPVINSPVQLSFRLVDTITNQQITDIQWRNHTWTVTASLDHQDVYQGQLLGTKAVTFDALTGTAEFTDLRLTLSGVCPVTFVVTSDPPEYMISGVVEVPLMTPMQRDLVVEETSVLEVSLPLTYDTTTAPFFAVLIRNHYSSRDDIRVVSHTHRAGSLVVTMTVEGTAVGVGDILMAVCDDISNGTTFTYNGTTVSLSANMMVNGQNYYGVSCYHILQPKGLHPGFIAAIVLACVLLITIIIVVVLWKFKVQPNTKTYDTNGHSKYTGPYRSDNIEDILFSENTFMSLKSQSTLTPVPPSNTALNADLILWRSNSDLPPMPGTPEPS